MSSSAAKPSSPNKGSGPTYEELQQLKVSAYDNTASLIVSLLVLFGMGVLILLGLWFSLRATGTQKAVPLEVVQVGDGGEGGSSGNMPDVAPVEDVPELQEPTPAQTLNVLPDAIALKKATFDTLEPEPTRGGSGTGRGTGRGNGTGSGSGEPMPEWEVRFAVSNIDAYAMQLDFFKFELAVLGGDNAQIEYVSNLAQAKPNVRIGSSGSEETRPYFSWKKGSPLLANDQKLLTKAGVNTGGRLILQFYPEAVYQKLTALEREASGGKRPDKTIFGVRENGAGYEFFVQDQAPPSTGRK